MNLPEELVTGRAVLAVRGVLIACSIVPGRPDCVLGLTKPVIGRPDCVIGLNIGNQVDWVCFRITGDSSSLIFQNLKATYLTAGVGPPPWLVPGSLSDVPGPKRKLYPSKFLTK